MHFDAGPEEVVATLSVRAARAAASEAFVYCFPLLVTLNSMEEATEPRDSTGRDRATLNRFGHFERFPDPAFRAVVAVNQHTLYSLAWLDLGAEPMVLNLPDTEGRSFSLSVFSAWSDTIACFGPQTPESAGKHLLAHEKWRGKPPARMRRLDSPTDTVLLVCHLHGHDAGDLAAARAVQQQLTLTPLSAYRHGDPAAAASILDPEAPAVSPLPAIGEMKAEEFFSRAAMAMGVNPAAERDAPILGRLAAIGFAPGKRFGWAKHSAEIHAAFEAGLADGKAIAATSPPCEELANGWRRVGPGLGRYGTDYARRAQAANLALGAVSAENACFPTCTEDAAGRQTNGANRYLVRFEPDELPETKALWSLAIYDMDQLCVANALDRYALGDRDDLSLGADGSLEIAIQHEQPGEAVSNWLPAPEGNFHLMLHMYSPSRKMLDGSWSIPPPMVEVD